MDGAIEELRADEHSRDHLLDARIEATLSARVEEWHQAIDVALGDRTTERTAGEGGSNAPRASDFAGRFNRASSRRRRSRRDGGGPADENLPATRRVRHAR